MIFPEECKGVGYASARPCGSRVYFLSEYVIRETPKGHEIVLLRKDPAGTGLMRNVTGEEVIIPDDEVSWYPYPVNIHNRAGIVALAMNSGTRCTIFRGLDEHLTFVIDPDLSVFLTVHVYDVVPPLPSLSATIRDLEACGMFAGLNVRFSHTLTDVGKVDADVHPCRAAGFTRTLDTDPMKGGETIAGCRASAGIFHECYGDDFRLIDICPVGTVSEGPFITRCCQKERTGICEINGHKGTVVHFGATPPAIYRAVLQLAREWREGCRE